MLHTIFEVMKTESFWALAIIPIALSLIAFLRILDQWRHPEIYDKIKNQPKAKTKKAFHGKAA